ncbi:MAG: FAD-dependent thymidylate synthase [Armatimonadetes bacterium]|nr:FAD-dependent thymidylate synthase [Armatimonadota bacterium]
MEPRLAFEDMNVTSVSLRPTPAAEAAGRPSLTPELLAASGARYSRNNEGLEAILSKIDPTNLDKSVDSIFRMIDYGHQSIADMVPVAVFVDGVSMLLAYRIWSWCPTAGGQESSTRYIRIGPEGLMEPHELGVPPSKHDTWRRSMAAAFEAYEKSVTFWTRLGERDPALMRLPSALIEDTSEKAVRQVARMRRNYAFDRARCFLPLAARTNVMLVMSARAWVQLCQRLHAEGTPEATRLAQSLQGELLYSAPRLMKHAEAKPSFDAGQAAERSAWRETASALSGSRPTGEACPRASVTVMAPNGVTDADIAASLSFHDNRYGFMGEAAARTMVRFGWDAVAMGEIRDLNRHRTGTKHCPLVPQGFYAALDQVPDPSLDPEIPVWVGDDATAATLDALCDGDAGSAAWSLLGTQFPFEHSTTLDKFAYEAELRTGTGAHYRYAKHLSDAVAELAKTFPLSAAKIALGTAEPE